VDYCTRATRYCGGRLVVVSRSLGEKEKKSNFGDVARRRGTPKGSGGSGGGGGGGGCAARISSTAGPHQAVPCMASATTSRSDLSLAQPLARVIKAWPRAIPRLSRRTCAIPVCVRGPSLAPFSFSVIQGLSFLRRSSFPRPISPCPSCALLPLARLRGLAPFPCPLFPAGVRSLAPSPPPIIPSWPSTANALTEAHPRVALALARPCSPFVGLLPAGLLPAGLSLPGPIFVPGREIGRERV
jgi:hypothetical protein